MILTKIPKVVHCIITCRVIIRIFHRYVHDPFGRVLQRARTSVVAQLHVKVQSDRRRGPAQTVTAGMSERVSVGWRAQKVNS